MEAREIVAALGGRWRGGRGIARCPAHADREPSLSIAQGDDGRLLVWCFAGCPFEAVRDALSRLGLLAAAGRRMCPPADSDRIARRDRERREEERRRIERARRIWARAGSNSLRRLVRAYWRSRGITLDPPPTIRSGPVRHREAGRRLEAVVAAIQGPGGALQGVHVTWLRPDGAGKANVAPVRKIIGLARGGVVRLAPAGPMLALAEGIETALAIQQETGLPCWAALSAGNLDGLTLPEVVRTVIVCADRDPAGEAGARAAAHAYLAAGREVRIARPPDSYKDFNDLLRADGRPREAA